MLRIIESCQDPIIQRDANIPSSVKLLTLYVSSCAMMNTGKEQGNPS